MPSLITVGTNTYQTESTATSYFSLRIGAEVWDSASVANREKALAQACKSIDSYPFIGLYAIDNQSLQWPRKYVLKHNSTDYYAETAYPECLLYAQAEEALMLLRLQADKGAAGMDTRIAQGTQEIRIGDIQLKYGEQVLYGGRLYSRIAWEFLQPLLLQTPNGFYTGANSANLRFLESFMRDGFVESIPINVERVMSGSGE